jgi:hypothetical protein
MQKVVGSNPISRSENPRNCGGFLVTEPDHRLTRRIRVNSLQSGAQRYGGGTPRDSAAFMRKEPYFRRPSRVLLIVRGGASRITSASASIRPHKIVRDGGRARKGGRKDQPSSALRSLTLT